MNDYLARIQVQDNYEIKKSNIHGRGVFSKIFFKKGDFINPHFVPDRKGKYKFRKITSFGAHLNHSYSPNAVSKKISSNCYLVYALKDIQPGEEITLDYTVNKELEQPKKDWK